MESQIPTYIGYAAGLLTTVAFFPQLVKIWRSRSADDVSPAMFVIFTTGVGLWLVYGVLIESWPVMAANAVTLALALAILVLTLRYRGNGPGPRA